MKWRVPWPAWYHRATTSPFACCLCLCLSLVREDTNLAGSPLHPLWSDWERWCFLYHTSSVGDTNWEPFSKVKSLWRFFVCINSQAYIETGLLTMYRKVRSKVSPAVLCELCKAGEQRDGLYAICGSPGLRFSTSLSPYCAPSPFR